MMKKWNVGKRLLSIMLASALGIVLCTGCGGSQGGSTQSGPGETAAVESTQTAASPEAASAELDTAGKEKTGDLRKMDVVLDWYPNALHAFLYTAIERGYFADEGLDVNIRFPANDNDAIALTAAGKAEIGLFYEHDAIQAVADQGVHIKSIGAVVQSPLNVILSLADIYKSKTRTYNRFFLYNVDALKFAYKNEDIARAYRNFGFFYVEENQLDIAAVFYDFSLNFDFNRQAFRELEYLKSRGINTEIDRKDAENIIESKKIQVGVNPFILDTLRIICADLENRKYYRGALYFYRILYDLTKDNHILGKINSIQNRI